MGFLTDPSGLHGRPLQILVYNQGKICFLLYLLSIVWYCLLAHEQINSGTYLSENALLPGLVRVSCGQLPNLSKIAGELSEELMEASSMLDEEGLRGKSTSRMPVALLEGKLRKAGIEEVYKHNFTLHYPLGKGAVYQGMNVYGIIRGGSASTESIVLSVPYRPPSPSSPLPRTDSGLALAFSVASCFRRQKYWAKDIILLITEHENLGTEAWLEAYHGVSCGEGGILQAGELEGRGGGIQAAINLEIPSVRLSSLRLKLLGLNGQLPNLDLVNLVHRISAKEKLDHSLYNTLEKEGVWSKGKRVPSGGFKESFLDSDWTRSLRVMTRMILDQASGVPDGNHGLYHRFGIEAVTLEGVGVDEGREEERQSEGGGGKRREIHLHHVSRVIEGIFRSVNNLLERFHQSYFFYLLVDTDRFVSIGLYMPCLGLVVGCLFLKPFALYLNLQSHLQSKMRRRIKVTGEYDGGLNGLGVSLVFLFSYLMGVMSLNWWRWGGGWWWLGGWINKTEDWLLSGVAFISLGTLVGPKILMERYGKGKEWIFLEIISLIHLGTFLIAIGMNNFSFGYLIGLLVTLPALSLKPSTNGFFRKLLILCIHPLSLLIITVGCSACLQFPLSEIPYRVLIGTKQSLILALVDSLIYGNWSHTVATLFYLPNWCMLWFACHAKRSCIDEKMEENEESTKTK